MREEVKKIFEMYIRNEIEIKEIQSWLATIYVDDKNSVEVIRKLDNRIEEIIYCYNQKNQRKLILQLYEDFLKSHI